MDMSVYERHLQDAKEIVGDVLSCSPDYIVGKLLLYAADCDVLHHCRDDTLLAGVLSEAMAYGRQDTFDAAIWFHEGDRRIYIGYRDLLKIHEAAVMGSKEEYAESALNRLILEMEASFERTGFMPLLDMVNSFSHPSDRLSDIFELALRSPNRVSHLTEMYYGPNELFALLARSEDGEEVLKSATGLADEVCWKNEDVIELLRGIGRKTWEEREKKLEKEDLIIDAYKRIARFAEKFNEPLSKSCGDVVSELVRRGITNQMTKDDKAEEPRLTAAVSSTARSTKSRS